MKKAFKFMCCIAAAVSLYSCGDDDKTPAPTPEPEPDPTNPTAVYNNDADLWANTASFTISDVASTATSVVVKYRIKGETSWNTVTAASGTTAGSYTATIAPTWTESTNSNQQTVYTVDPKTGVFAKKTYEYEVLVDDSSVSTGEFTPANNSGDIIPNAGFSNWRTAKRSNIMGMLSDVPYPNAEEEDFWNSGNNGSAKKLCTESADIFGTEAPSARMKSSATLGVMAAGNLFTGEFEFINTTATGAVDFGKKYTYTARPTALKLKYHAPIVGLVDVVRTKGDLAPGIAKGDQDHARIFVAIVDWSTQHRVASSAEVKLNTTEGAWNPEAGADVVSEGKVIGYGVIWIGETTTGMQDAELQINWYDKTAKPAADNYSIVISCACNAYGDYFTGCSTNELYVDDFEWVY